MISLIAADLALIAHFLIVTFAVFAGFLLILGDAWLWIHPSAAWTLTWTSTWT